MLLYTSLSPLGSYLAEKYYTLCITPLPLDHVISAQKPFGPIRPADEIYNAKLQKRLSFDSVVSCVKSFE
jgi:hypothetical protein